jgi:hypothetical protein
MKTIIISLFLILSLSAKSQNTDVMWVPDQNTLVASYTNYSQIGWYIGGYYTTSFPAPFVYTTPASIFNRVGLSFTNRKNTYSVMGGVFAESISQNKVNYTPDVWFKVYPLRALLKTSRGPDFALGINYTDELRVGVGLSIPLGIYR